MQPLRRRFLYLTERKVSNENFSKFDALPASGAVGADTYYFPGHSPFDGNCGQFFRLLQLSGVSRLHSPELHRTFSIKTHIPTLREHDQIRTYCVEPYIGHRICSFIFSGFPCTFAFVEDCVLSGVYGSFLDL